MAQIPDFKTLEEEVEFWETHDSAEYWDEMEEVTFEVDLHKNLLHPKLVVLTSQPPRCPRCREALEHIVIKYVAWSDEKLLIINDVPALRCQANGHEYMLEDTLDYIEYVLEDKRRKKLQPAETIKVPAFNFRMLAAAA